MRFVRDLSEGIGGRSGNGDGGYDAGLDHAEGKQRCAKAADDRLKGLGKFGGLEIVSGHLMGEQRGGCEDRGDGRSRCQRGSQYRVDAAEADVFGGHSLVDGGALLEEKHPGRNGGADVGEHDQQSVFIKAGKRLPGEECMAYRMPTGVGHERDWNEYQVEYGGGESDAFPSPIAMTHERGVKNDESNQDCNPGRHSEKTQAGSDGDELGDESEEVSDAQVDHGKPSPEGTEALEDQFGVSPMSGGAEAHRHLLHDDRHAKRESYERDEEADTKFGASRGVGKHAGAVILAQHDQDAGADQQPQQASSGGKAAPGTSLK